MQTHRDGGGRTTMKAARFQELSDDSTPFLPPSSSHGERSQIREDCSPVIDLCDVRASILAYSTTTIAEIVMLNRNAVLEIRGMGQLRYQIELLFYFTSREMVIFIYPSFLYFILTSRFSSRFTFMVNAYLYVRKSKLFIKNCI